MLRMLSLGAFATALLSLSHAGADDKKDDKKPAPVTAVAPNPLDGVFAKAKTETDITNTLINDPLYKKAIAAALKAKQEREAAMKKVPIGPSPESAARIKFIEVLSGAEKTDEKK